MCAALALAFVGVLLGLYGVLAIAYNGDGNAGDTYVTVAGREIDSHLVGLTAVAVAVITILGSIRLVRRGRCFGEMIGVPRSAIEDLSRRSSAP